MTGIFYEKNQEKIKEIPEELLVYSRKTSNFVTSK